ncbi:hypothetical protein [Abditibacterium utsteinense]|uniref:hypothetical protein n=1 Tax=Abditibacterium utsteinense TaxID=1960156 RepID=UPI000F47F157|nr:hypothetical protein [Abditibacterium utsteinense]
MELLFVFVRLLGAVGCFFGSAAIVFGFFLSRVLAGGFRGFIAHNFRPPVFNFGFFQLWFGVEVKTV